ncbi:integrase [Rhodanobacter sp. FW510-R12]|uniref:Integrase n=1 Tax=Rhodanobacter thiooxydans TaxID=416169 RepID=A0A154QEH8_9GAMM|nr:integrase [Rhodanobacter denitrificans]KZC22697.1 integrase [Rhodanobacter thiooxydans]
MNILHELRPLASVPVLDPALLDAAGARAAQEFVADGTPANTARSYASALRYWAAWYALRYGQVLGDTPVSVAVASQFIVDHLERKAAHGLQHELPAALDARLVALGAKAKLGALAYATVAHRLAVLAKWHRLHDWEPPGDDHRIKTLMAKARRAQAKRGVTVRKKTALVAEPLQAMLATCTDGVRGLRDRALLLLAWSGGGRRRSEVVGIQIDDIRRLGPTTWTYALGHTKTNATGGRREKPLRGEVVLALEAWIEAVQLTEGALFRRVYRNGRAGAALTPDQVARIVQRRATLAELPGDWAAHSLRSGFVTEAGRQGVPLGEVMAMTEHRSVGTVMGYFQAGALLSSRATDLLAKK